jgi:hypothetical protein
VSDLDMRSLSSVLARAVLCILVGAVPVAAQPSAEVDALVACMAGADFSASDDCADALKALSQRDPSVGADARVHRAFAARLHRDTADFQEWQRWVSTKSEEEQDRESYEYEDGTSAMLLADTIRFQLLPNAGPDTERVLFEALLAATVMNGEMERGIAKYGQRAASATLGFARSDAVDRRRIGYSVLGWMLDPDTGGVHGSPLSGSDRAAAARAITAGLQEAEPDVRLTAIRAAQRGRVADALPVLRVFAVTMPDDQPYRLRQAAIDAVASLTH